jgi:type I restriction-modification system DNA methylase subunit
MKAFSPYVEKLERQLQHLDGDRTEVDVRIRAALDGEVSRELARLVTLPKRREYGTFFTSSKLASVFFAQAFDPTVSTYFDPTCGAGDLLLVAARSLPLKRTLKETLKLWGCHLAGTDVHEEFIRVTRARIMMLAVARGVLLDLEPTDDFSVFLPHLKVADALSENHMYRKYGSCLINPPFGPVPAPKDCLWAKGKITAAAIFLEHALKQVKKGGRITAILPDVLRSGSRYHRWRQMVERVATISKVSSYGLFDHAADVDVFILTLIKTDNFPNDFWPLGSPPISNF